jgi:hypothetical protein
LQIVFFDGEEAFHDWTATDSIYGSRYVVRPRIGTKPLTRLLRTATSRATGNPRFSPQTTLTTPLPSPNAEWTQPRPSYRRSNTSSCSTS